MIGETLIWLLILGTSMPALADAPSGPGLDPTLIHTVPAPPRASAPNPFDVSRPDLSAGGVEQPTPAWQKRTDILYKVMFKRLLAATAVDQERARQGVGVVLRLEGEPLRKLWNGSLKHGVTERPAAHGPDPTHRADVEAALRQRLLSGGSFLQLSVTTQDPGSAAIRGAAAVLYLRFD